MAFLVSFSRGGCVAGLAIVAADTAAPTSELVVSDIQIVGLHLRPLPGERQKLWAIMFTTTGAKREGLGSKPGLNAKHLVDRLLRQAMPKYGRPLAA